MSDFAFVIDLPPATQASIKKIDGAAAAIPQAIARGMSKSLEVVRGRIQSNRLIGKGPFPVGEHRLGQVTQQLWRSARATPAVVKGTEIVGAIGSPVIYAAVHEFGFHGAVQVRSKKGNTFVRQMDMPERAPFRTEIGQNLEYISGEIGKEVEDTLTK
jgi:hypothetical protein